MTSSGPSSSRTLTPNPLGVRDDWLAAERAASPEQTRDALIDRAAKLAPDIADLIRRYFRYLPPEEVIGDDPSQLVGAVRSNYLLAENRVPGRPSVKLINPTVERDGWSRAATIVQMVTDDMPYLVDSVVAELTRGGVNVQRVVHPIVVVRRDLSGKLLAVEATADPETPPAGSLAESWMSIDIDQVTDVNRAAELERRLMEVLNDVREVVEDTDKMTNTARTLADSLESARPPVPAREIGDAAKLLRWLADGHFTFLGYRRYELVGTLRPSLASGLGVLRSDNPPPSPDTAAHDPAHTGRLLLLTEASEPSTVHCGAYPYYVGVKTFDEQGNVNGEHLFLGVLTSAAMYEDVLNIPVIERRVREVLHRARFPQDSYSGHLMLDVIQNYPRPELFSTETDALYETVTGVLALADRRRVRLFLRRDPYRRFYSCLVYLPRDRYTTTTRLAMTEVLLRALSGRQIEYSARVGETPIARVHFMVYTDPSTVALEPDPAKIQRRLAEAVRGWDDRMIDAVLAARGEEDVETATILGQRYAAAFPESYKEIFSATVGLADMHRLRALQPDALDVSFYQPEGAEDGEHRFKLYLAGERVTLSTVLPLLQRMGAVVVDERPYEVHRDDGITCWIFDFGLRFEPAPIQGDADLRDRFERAFAAAWRGQAEVDGFNELVVRAGLTWRQATIPRTYAKYLRQARSPYSQDYIEDVVLGHTEIVTRLVRLFEARHDPALSSEERATITDELTTDITARIDAVASLDADRILRNLLSLVNATLRTNYFVRDAAGQPRPYLAVKLDPKQVPGLPEPRPRFEIFVCSPRVEGVHLRFGPVARGGLRWSDRRQDFRTEILGLVKAQAVKNAVIVPVGAKGGFVVKRPPAPTGDAGKDREATLTEGVACYRMFVSGLLDLTDNLDHGKVVPAPSVVRHDGDDTYLVVAADKGTARFSDIANDVAAQYGFWLGDAFASGGSVGYDHKQMGITARGAWESVSRYFRELGVDTQSQEFTVVGIGDMSGDVFGNGMLLSEHIKLVAAFDHRHIFLDPDPDPAGSFVQRQRLFALPRSSWDDYERSAISPGGGVWPRTAKSIAISEQARRALGLADDVTRLSPGELMKAILVAPVDLLWNGGIGTY
ncbi:MAG TPA: NAD-glutamate dehydrogenase domain-containing protein, partial [Pseudonocardiaceae bacterium]